ncbi:MAG TPA: SigB/SigF/SigG family RNA polymerase sigma factor [Streptosporangiaceae bacterium]|nr:SigB/SigF/SigG family RNA polymerase sigma factor [Streptosporangiaceae bacterium]
MTRPATISQPQPAAELPAHDELPPCDLEQRDDAELLDMVRSLPREHPARETACEVLVNRYRPLVRSCARRFQNSPEPYEDLLQVGYVGLIKAINNFDPAAGTGLAGYALPCVSGEIKRYFRDKRWQVHVRRSLQELRLSARNVAAELTQTLGHSPSDAEIAERLDITEDELREVRRAELAFQSSSLDAPLTDDQSRASLADLIGGEDPQLEHVLDMEAVWTHLGGLPAREQQLLLLRFYGNMTQAEIGKHLGISQMHVSRLLSDALDYLRERLLEPA